MLTLSRDPMKPLAWAAIATCVECRARLLLGWDDLIHTELGRTYESLYCYESHDDWRFFCAVCGLNQPLVGEALSSARHIYNNTGGSSRYWEREWYEFRYKRHGNCHMCSAEDHRIGDCPLMPKEGFPLCSLCTLPVPPHWEDRDDGGRLCHNTCIVIERNNPNQRRRAA